jgi:hypothetical protein
MQESVSEMFVSFNHLLIWLSAQEDFTVFPHSNKEVQFYKSVKKCMYYLELNLVFSNGHGNYKLCRKSIRLFTGNAINCFSITCAKYYVPVSYLPRSVVLMTYQYIITSYLFF